MGDIYDKGHFLYDMCNEKERCEYEVTKYAKELYRKYYASFYCEEKFSADVMTSGKGRLLPFFVFDRKEISVDQLWEGLIGWEDVMWKKYYANDNKSDNGLDIKLLKSIRVFVRVNHTLGNFILIPRGYFNNAKAGGGHKDHFDFCMFYLERYFKENDKGKVLKDWLGKWNVKKECTEWLSWFGDGEDGWHKFVDLNFLQDYVVEGYKPIQFKTLEPIDKIEDCNLPGKLKMSDNDEEQKEIKEEWLKWFNNVTQLIIKRGYRIMHSSHNEIPASELKDVMENLEI